MSDNLVKRLRQSWDADRSIMSQTERWMAERVDAADRIEELEAELLETQDRANAFATKEYYTEMRAERAEAKLAKALLIIEAYGDDEGYIPKRVVHLWNELKGEDNE